VLEVVEQVEPEIGTNLRTAKERWIPYDTIKAGIHSLKDVGKL